MDARLCVYVCVCVRARACCGCEFGFVSVLRVLACEYYGRTCVFRRFLACECVCPCYFEYTRVKIRVYSLNTHVSKCRHSYNPC
jgi:hypothetical protein